MAWGRAGRTKNGRVDVFLQRPDLKDPLRPRQLLRVKDIRATAIALSKISGDLEKLWDDIEESFMPKELRVDEEADSED